MGRNFSVCAQTMPGRGAPCGQPRACPTAGADPRRGDEQWGMAVSDTPKNEQSSSLSYRRAREDRAVELVTLLCRREGADKILPLIDRWIRMRRSRAVRCAAQGAESGHRRPR
jgi:hypothetical protein